jgi:hypothetical protein
VYPLNWAFWDGKMSEELYHEEHPLDALQQMQENAEAAAAVSTSVAAHGQREVEARKGNK